MRLLVLLILILITGCAPQLAVKTEIPQDNLNIRSYLQLNNIPYTVCSETETVSSGVGYKHLNDLCNAMGGQLYLSKPVIKSGFSGGKVVFEETPYDKIGFFALTSYSNPVCKKEGSILFKITEGETGNYGTSPCKTMVITHEPIPEVPYMSKDVRENLNLPFNDFVKKIVSGKVLDDGSFFRTLSRSTCTAHTFPYELPALARYCEHKGGKFLRVEEVAVNITEDGKTVKKVIAPAGTPYNKLICALGIRTDWVDKLWGTYVCEHPSEPFTVRLSESRDTTLRNIQYNIREKGIIIQVASGIHAQVRPQVSEQPREDRTFSLILETAKTKSPQYLNEGSMRYSTTYNGEQGGCSLVSMITEVEKMPNSRKIMNYKVCGSEVIALGETGTEFGRSEIPGEARQKAKEIYQSCKLYGSAKTNWSSVEINCSVPNKQLPCLLQLNYMESGRLLGQEIVNACR